MTTETISLNAGARESTSRAPGSRWLALVLAFVGSLVGGIALVVALVAGIEAAYADRVLPGVSIGGVELGGLTREAAAERLAADLPALESGTLTLTAGDETVRLDYRALGRRYDTDTMVSGAFAIGHSGDTIPRGVEELRTVVRGAQITARVLWDEAAVATALHSLAVDFDRPATNATAARDKAGNFVYTVAQAGRRIDQAATAAQIRALLDTPSAPPDATLEMAVLPVAPDITTSEATFAIYRANLISSVDLILVVGDDTWTIPAAEVRRWIHFEQSPAVGIDVSVIGPQLEARLKKLAKEIDRKPKDASFLVAKGGKNFGVLTGRNGRALDIPGSMTAIEAALDDLVDEAPSPRVELAVTITQPRLTTEDAAKAAPLMTRLGTWTTYYPPGEGNYYGKNIQIPARIISGTVVPAGTWFSFWNTVGIPTPEQGYGPGGFIKNGKSTIGALAGGICSTSTTLFNAAVRAGLQIGKRSNHYYYIPRYPLGLDATVSMYSGRISQDVTFRNDTRHPILILSYNSYGVVRFDIYGVYDGRKVSFSKPIVRNVVKATDSVVYTTAIPAGTEKRVEFPHDGMDVWVTRTVTRKGVVIHRETYQSDYRRVDGILWIGVAG